MRVEVMKANKILVRAPNWIGDQILAYPFFFYLRRTFPRARITVACVPWVESLQFQDLVDEVHVLPRPLRDSWMARFTALEDGALALRASGPYDVGFSLPNSFSAAWLIYRAGVNKRCGYRTDGRSFLLNEGVDWQASAGVHRAEAYVRLLPREIWSSRDVLQFWGVPPENDLDPGIPGELARFDSEASWPGVELVDPPNGPYWVLAPGATAESRRWSAENFAALARVVVGETGWMGVVVGGAGEAPIAARLCEDQELRLIDMTAQGAPSCYSKVFAGAKFSVTNDSGLAHVASLCGSPVQIVWGGGDPKRTEALGPGKVRIVFNPVDCWPCERNGCTQPSESKLQCLRGIRSAEVWEEIKNGIRP
jgi:heptosyltransferase II